MIQSRATNEWQKVAIIILHYKNVSDTSECLSSLSQLDYPCFEIILIDNGSADDLQSLQTLFPQVIFLRNEKNLGFAEGNNRALFFAQSRGADYMLLLNNDTVVAHNLLSVFVRTAQEHPSAGVFGAKIFYYDDPTVIWHAGGNVHIQKMRYYHYGCMVSDLGKKWDEIREINYACGCALFVKAEILTRIGGMAPEFFLVWEEIDWCWRIRRAGYRCLFVPQARVWHKISQTFEGGNHGPLRHYYYFRNRLLFLRRNFPFRKRAQFYFGLFSREIIKMLWGAFHPSAPESQRNLYRHELKGICDYFLGNFYAYENGQKDKANPT